MRLCAYSIGSPYHGLEEMNRRVCFCSSGIELLLPELSMVIVVASSCAVGIGDFRVGTSDAGHGVDFCCSGTSFCIRGQKFVARVSVSGQVDCIVIDIHQKRQVS